jgi:hypothetical protein
MRTRITRGAAIIAAALLSTAALVPAAQADVQTFVDTGGHLTTVRVRHGADNVRVKAHVGPMRIGSYFTFWLDTDAENPGPEYKTKVYPNSDGVFVKRIEAFGDAGTNVDCDGFRASADVFGPEDVTILVPRSCIGTPTKIRVSIRAYYDVPGPNVVDWGPGRKKFFGWVER